MEQWQVWAAAITGTLALVGTLFGLLVRFLLGKRGNELLAFDQVSDEMRALRAELVEARAQTKAMHDELLATKEELKEALWSNRELRRSLDEAILREGQQEEQIKGLRESLKEAHDRIRDQELRIAQLRKDFNGKSE